MSMSGLSQTRRRFTDGMGEVWEEIGRLLRETAGLRVVERDLLMPAEKWGERSGGRGEVGNCFVGVRRRRLREWERRESRVEGAVRCMLRWRLVEW